MNNRFKDASKLIAINVVKKEFNSKKVSYSVDPVLKMAPILEGILQRIENKSMEQIISEFYIGASQLWGSIESWPKKIEKFYGRLNYKVKNPESTACVESRERMVVRAIKNLWLSTTGASFEGRYERLKKVSQKNIKEDGSTIGIRILREKNSKGDQEESRAMSSRDYKIAAGETHGRAIRYKINKDGKKQFVEFVK